MKTSQVLMDHNYIKLMLHTSCVNHLNIDTMEYMYLYSHNMLYARCSNYTNKLVQFHVQLLKHWSTMYAVGFFEVIKFSELHRYWVLETIKIALNVHFGH